MRLQLFPAVKSLQHVQLLGPLLLSMGLVPQCAHAQATMFGVAAPGRCDAIILPAAPSSVLVGSGPSPDANNSATGDSVSISGLPKRIVFDELHLVTSPARVRRQDLKWLLPLAGATAASFATDTHTMRDVVTHDPGVISASGTASDALRDGFLGVPVLLFGAGVWQHDARSREAGLLGGEAMVDAYAFGAVLKFVTFRERPLEDNARGAFFQGVTGGDSSFPSGHAIVAWSSAAVLAGEYSKPWQQVGIYTLASGVSLTRLTTQQHFPSDVLVGSAVGWLIGHYVYRAHHRLGR